MQEPKYLYSSIMRGTLRSNQSQNISDIKNLEEDDAQQARTILALSCLEGQKDDATVVCGH